MGTAIRKIIHVDMDCFYAAVETRDNPSLENKPVAVGGRPEQRGVVATANYLAREFGVHSAMATAYAFRLCPDLVLVPPRMSHYRDVSDQIRAIFRRYTPIIEPLSLDEAYLDVTDSEECNGSASLLANKIRQNIRSELKLTASAGIAPNKFLAKICSDEKKPDGQCVLTPENVPAFIKSLPLSKIPGVGKATLKKLAAHQLYSCGDVQRWSQNRLGQTFGSLGKLLYLRAQGIDDRSVNTSWTRKSISVERTFAKDIRSLEHCLNPLDRLFSELLQRIERHGNGRLIKSLQIKLKFDDFQATTVERQASGPSLEIYVSLLESAWLRGKGRSIRLMGLGVGLQERSEDYEQLSLLLES